MKKRTIITLLIAFVAMTILSCCSDDEGTEVNNLTFIDNLPEAEDIRSTSVFVPVRDKGIFRLLYSLDNDLSSFYMGSNLLSTYLVEDSCGFYLRGLEPDTTYYYTMVCLMGDETIASHQVKTFTTKSVGIAFIEPETVSMGNWDREVLRVRTMGIEESDVPLNLFVQFHRWPQNDPSGISLSAVTSYVGDGIWKDDNTPVEGYCYQAEVKTHHGRIVARTPVILWTDGRMVEL